MVIFLSGKCVYFRDHLDFTVYSFLSLTSFFSCSLPFHLCALEKQWCCFQTLGIQVQQGEA